jgi:formylglycine-generating enzyme required for sulfatase activity
MLGNVWEWVADNWHEDYQGAPEDGSVWEGADAERVVRGGSWDSEARGCRSAYRDGDRPGVRGGSLGFRPARVQVSSGKQGAQPDATAGAAQAEPADQRGWRGEAGALYLPPNQRSVSYPLPDVARLRLRSEREIITLQRRTEKPSWASAMGRDGFGLWAEFSVESEVGTVRQCLRWIPPGRFLMGSPEDEPGRSDFEGPAHPVILEKGYWLFDTPVTQALWLAVMEDNPSGFQSADRPVEQVSWKDSQRFLEKLNELKPGLELSLPSEAQWEYACRAGTETALYTGPLEIEGANNAPALHEIAWYGGNSGKDFDLEEGYDATDWPEKQFDFDKVGSRLVRQKAPNPWGLYDMLGNVWEWTADAWHKSYEGAPVDGSVWDDGEAGAERVLRGGSWGNKARLCRSACRGGNPPDLRRSPLGFRPARVQS